MEITAQNAIYLDEETGGKGRQFRSRFLVPGLVKYDYGVCLLTKENADKFIQGFVGCPIVINHQDVTDDNAREISVGNIFSVWFDDKDGYYWCNGIITDKHAIELIDKGYSVSCQYTITEYSDNTTGALHNGNPYDKVIENGKPEHLAIVNNPRYEGAIIAVNSTSGKLDFVSQFKDTLYTALAEGIANRLGELIASNEDKWITVKPNGEENKGRHLLIKDGETVEDAMHRNGWYKKRQAKKDNGDILAEELKNLRKELNESIKNGSFSLKKEYFDKKIQEIRNRRKQLEQKEQKDNKKQDKKEKQKEIIANVKRGKPMSFNQANEGKVNPNYNKGGGYKINCQSCVAVFEARLRGYNIETKPYNKNDKITKELAYYPERAYIDKQTGKAPKTIQDESITSNKTMLKWLDKQIKAGQRYGFIFDHSRGRHIITAYKTDKGELKFYDPQSGEHGGENMLETIRYKRQRNGLKIKCPPEIFRVDNADFNFDFMNHISTGAKK